MFNFVDTIKSTIHMISKFLSGINIVLIACIFLFSCADSKSRHIGEWSNNDGGRNWVVKFTPDSLVQILDDSIPVLGGPYYKLNDGQPGTCRFEIDYTKNPIWLDVVVFPKDQKMEIGRIKGIVRFISSDKMEWRINPTGERFKNFDNQAPNEVTRFKRLVSGN